jgi:Ion channel
MFIAMLLSVTLVVGTIFIHFEALRFTSTFLPLCGQSGRSRMFVVIAGIFLAHMVEISLYALGYFSLEQVASLGELGGAHDPTLMGYLYYSVVSFTSLGLGDIVPAGHLRVISGIEALNGLVLIGWSTSFTFLAMRRYWPIEIGGDGGS